MASRHASLDLYVYMNNQNVGILSKQSSGQLSFTYVSAWLENKEARPISLSMPLREQNYNGDKVYNFFDNLLPDNESLRRRIQKRFAAPSNQCFDLLSYIGADCVGALQLLSQPLSHQSQDILAEPVTNQQIAKILKNYREAPLGMQVDNDFRISIAGTQEKTAFLRYKNEWCLPHQSTPTTHIFKLPIGKVEHSRIDLSESVENEWLCLQILEKFNLPVNNANIVEFEDVKVLVCERFDRKWNADNSFIFRLPQEDLCQVFSTSSTLKYESDGGPGIKKIMDFLNGSYHAEIDRTNFFKSLFLFWVLGAIDGHAKNFSIFINTGGRFQLTPLYDVLSAYPLANKKQLEWKKLKMAMSVQAKNKHYHWNEISKRHWEEMANFCKFSNQTLENIIEEIFENIDNVIDSVTLKLPNSFPLEIAESIFNGMKKAKNKFK